MVGGWGWVVCAVVVGEGGKGEGEQTNEVVQLSVDQTTYPMNLVS